MTEEYEVKFVISKPSNCLYRYMPMDDHEIYPMLSCNITGKYCLDDEELPEDCPLKKKLENCKND